LLQPSPVPATPFVERLRTEAGRRTLGIGLALLIEGLLLLVLLSLSSEKHAGDKEESITVVNLKADEVSEEAPEPSSPEREQRAEERPVPQRPAIEEPLPAQPAQPLPPQPAEPKTQPTAPPIMPTPPERPPSAAILPNPARPAPFTRPVYGPPDTGGSSASRDTERVGTAPNGEPLYAAAWYREPRDDQLRPYLSTASGPGWGLIACRTAPDYRVEDCVGLDEYPHGSQINRAVLAAAWEFKVRPPRLGGRSQVGSWVRIRIDYGLDRR
jgi:protein TonB